MRLIGMRFMGIGPYEGEFSIDFVALNRSHMFLIEGETGSGKSTILDCISFALYGGVSVDDASKDRLRSRFLDTQQTPSFVDLIFTVNGRYYRVRREPAYMRRKKRGEGTIAENATGKLWEIDGGLADVVEASEAPAGDAASDGSAAAYFDYAEADGHAKPLASQARDTNIEVGKLLHLTRDQFSKTAMLAQGQFSSFLKCRPEERTQLIKSLFSADVYERIQKTLDTMRKQHADVVDGQRRELRTAIHEMRDVAERVDALADGGEVTDGLDGAAAGAGASDAAAWGLDDAGDVAEPAMEPQDIAARLGKRMDEAAARARVVLRRCRNGVAESDEWLQRAQRDLTVLTQMRQALNDEREAKARRDALSERRPDMDGHRAALERSRKAAPVVRAADDCAAVAAEIERQQRALADVRQNLNGLESADAMTKSREEALRQAAGRPMAEAALQSALTLREQLDKLAAAQQRAAQRREQAERLRDEADAADSAVARLDDPATVEDRIRELVRREALQAQLDDRLHAANGRLDHARKRDADRWRLDGLRAAAKEAGADRAAAKDAYEQAQETFLSASAAALADRLVTGHPCPVCGGTEHPSPAVRPQDVPDEDHLAELADRMNAAVQRAADAANAVSLCEQLIDSEDRQAEGLGEAAAETAVRKLREECDAAAQLTVQRKRLETRLAEIRAKTEDAKQRRQQAEVAAVASDSAQELAESAETACLDAETGKPYTDETAHQREEQARQAIAACDDQAARAEELGRLIARRAELEQRADRIESAVATLGEQHARAMAQRDELLAAGGFATEDEARAAALDESAAARLQAALDRYAADTEVAAAELARIRRELDGLLRTPTCRAIAAQADDGIRAIAEELPDALTAAQTRVAAAEQAHEAAIRAEEQAVGLDTDRERRAATLAKAAQVWAASCARFAPIRDMALLASGRSESPAGDGLSLVTYAVTERFRDVLDRANDILKDIRGGVYELRLGTHEGRAVKTGLPIEVFDRRSDLATEASTLSGGETFFVSLALSLALADIIQAENGGISMDTLFIDEGFGSLSEDYLDDVLAVLRSMSRHRDIGVISHVGLLKDQIPERISVTRITEDSSSRLTVIV
ncbi:AAA family ATPase [Bifidobacterium sp. SMB2]|uniref:Nuclease SbcCD subunit C n=1 Tax=Bifidobacterium saimiriisciurei TaxID=2661627 RepID=A0ABX0CAV7_9BIFI|nr:MULTISPECIES: SMC family ATPase [Bifidobacterium]NEG96234.1 AAA family ATPase [Bifidobacterium sp. SMB2]NEH12247.1 AAA family ATPase [Bifidobacterium saimiriisciurei]